MQTTLDSSHHLGLDLRAQGDGAVRVGWNRPVSLDAVRDFTARLAAATGPGWLEIVPGYATVTVFYDPYTLAFATLRAAIVGVAAAAAIDPDAKTPAPPAAPTPRTIEIPVWYGLENPAPAVGASAANTTQAPTEIVSDDDAAPDLPFVAQHAGMSVADTIALHHETVYTVAMIGFQPGFPYLAGLPEKLHTPRLDKPRLRVPAGSVAIGGTQTGVYPFAAPGGWRLIGRTPTRLFDPTRAEPCLCRSGDKVRFKPITRAEFLHASR